ncbi:MAG: hypothetical protein J3R72DRAFT_452015 [Linnemannia gamsii]|nr:MAG: hypothetical protein J3R72DRAFT_452015 [Linnemannia gamsii]
MNIDKRIPPEVWERIFSRLYPSQLSRLSMVNKTFNKIVSSLSTWSRIFFVAHSGNENKRLRTLRDMPESKSYMLYMCAMSLYVCECCLFMAHFKANINEKPKQRQAPMRALKNDKFEYDGEEVDMHWTVNMCQSCFVSLKDTYTPCLDIKTRERLLWYKTQP